jgi:Iodothyronine deiodinase
VRRLDLSLPLVLDEMDNRASVAFAAWPERLVLVGADRRVVYPGSPGPWGFSPEEAREQLVAQLERR